MPNPTIEQTTSMLPPRPQDLVISGIDPCALLTDGQRAELDVTRARERSYEEQSVCAFTVETDERNVEVALMLDTREGAEAWLAGGRNVDAETATIGGYGAAHFWLKGATEERAADCSTAVDVAGGQNLQVSLFLAGAGWTLTRLCETTDRFAAAALKTLRAG